MITHNGPPLILHRIWDSVAIRHPRIQGDRDQGLWSLQAYKKPLRRRIAKPDITAEISRAKILDSCRNTESFCGGPCDESTVGKLVNRTAIGSRRFQSGTELRRAGRRRQKKSRAPRAFASRPPSLCLRLSGGKVCPEHPCR